MKHLMSKYSTYAAPRVPVVPVVPRVPRACCASSQQKWAVLWNVVEGCRSVAEQ